VGGEDGRLIDSSRAAGAGVQPASAVRLLCFRGFRGLLCFRSDQQTSLARPVTSKNPRPPVGPRSGAEAISPSKHVSVFQGREDD
jgi:hypothetical protein